VGSVGDREVKLTEVKGKVDRFGLPASREIKPGVLSRGRRPRTVVTRTWRKAEWNGGTYWYWVSALLLLPIGMARRNEEVRPPASK
jgi:hypothetical protein